MEKRSLISEAFEIWQKDRAAAWDNPSWWNAMVLWPLPFVLFFCVHTSISDLKIAQRQRTTVATINSHDPPNHSRYGYVFELNKSQFSGWAYPNDKRSFSIGQTVGVYYDPADPARNSTDDFHAICVGDLFFVPFCLIALPGVPVFIFFRRRSWKRRTVRSISE
jgi:hypothetical protein